MKLDYKRTFVLGLGFFGIAIIWSVYNSFVPIFLRDYVLPWWLVGLVMTFDNILGITLLPYIGQLSDGTRTRFGRRMPYIMIGTPIAALFVLAIPFIHLNLEHVGSTMALMMACIIVMNVAMAIFRTPTVALMPDITPSVLRSKANGIINLMGGLGTSIAFLIGGMLFARNAAYPFALAAIVLLIAESIVVWRVKEPQEYTMPQEQARPALLQSLHDTIGNVIEIWRAPEESALFICLAIFCWFMAYNAVEAFWTSYGREVIYAAEIASGAMSSGQAVARSTAQLTYLSVAFLLFALPAGFVATRFGRKRTILTGLGLLAVLWLGLLLIPNPLYVTVALIISGIAWACVNINSLPIMADLAPLDKVGAYTGLYYFFSMLAASTSPTIVGWLMDLVGIKVMFLFASLFMALAFFCMARVRRSEPIEPTDLQGALEMVAEADM